MDRLKHKHRVEGVNARLREQMEAHARAKRCDCEGRHHPSCPRREFALR